ncbi:26882_t:CDS:1, partial [Gigaspora margarita]
ELVKLGLVKYLIREELYKEAQELLNQIGLDYIVNEVVTLTSKLKEL